MPRAMSLPIRAWSPRRLWGCRPGGRLSRPRAQCCSRRPCSTMSLSRSAPRSMAQGRIRSPRHARKGEQLARTLLWRDAAAVRRHSISISRAGCQAGSPPRAAALVSRQGRPGAGRGGRQPGGAARPRSAAGRGRCARADLCRSARAAGADRSVSALLRGTELSDTAARSLPPPIAGSCIFVIPDATLHYDAYDDTRFEVILRVACRRRARIPGCASTPATSRSSRWTPFGWSLGLRRPSALAGWC